MQRRNVAIGSIMFDEKNYLEIESVKNRENIRSTTDKQISFIRLDILEEKINTSLPELRKEFEEMHIIVPCSHCCGK